MADLNIGNSTANVIVNAKHNGAVNPQVNNTYDLGTSDLRWKNIYGSLKGNADTATTATNLASAGIWTWTGGTTAGPTASLVLGGKTTSIGAVPSASSSASGIITTGTQTISGEKTFTSNLLIKRNTPNLYITDTNTGVKTFSAIHFGSTNASGTTNETAASIFLNGPQRTDDGGANLMTIRNNVGDLKLGNDVINTGKLTIGQGTKNASYKLYVNGTQYIQSNSNSSTTKGLTINNGILSINNYNQILSIGAQNTSWTHFETTGSQFYFNKQIHIDGNLTKHNYSDAGYGTISGYNLAGNATTATISRSLGTDDTMKVYGQYNDEVDFGGTNNSSTIYFGYRAVDSKPIPSKFIFGGNSGTAELVAAKFTGTLNGNANTATKFASAQSITLTGDTTGTASSQAGWSIGTTTYKLTNIGFLDTVEKLDGFIEANKLKYATVGSVGGVNSDGMIISVPWSSSGWGHQVFLDDSAMVIQHRHRYAKTNSDGSTVPAWSEWATLVDSNNYTNYTVTKTGSGASGTWGINISGSSKNISYPARLTTNDAIDAFNIGNVFQVSTWDNTSSPGVSNGIIINAGWTNATYGAQIAIDDDPTYFMALRQRGGNGWNAWKRIPMGDGTGASGTWGISISENAATSTISRSLGRDETMKVYGEVNNEVNFGGTNGTSTIYFGYRAKDSKPIPSEFIFGGANGSANIIAGKVYGAVWNDYAEYRETHHEIEPGRCVIEVGDGSLTLSFGRLQPGANIVSDTFGFAIGETETNKTPLAVSGRVLAYPNEPRESYHPGDPVCSGPNGTISRMTREEVREWPDRIVGTVSEIPNYETWGTGNVEVNGRIWIKVK